MCEAPSVSLLSTTSQIYNLLLPFIKCSRNIMFIYKWNLCRCISVHYESTRAAFVYLLRTESVTKRIWNPFKSLFVDPEQNSTPNASERSAPALLYDWPRLTDKIKFIKLPSPSFSAFFFFWNRAGVYFNLITLFGEQGFTDILCAFGDCVPVLHRGDRVLLSLGNGPLYV